MSRSRRPPQQATSAPAVSRPPPEQGPANVPSTTPVPDHGGQGEGYRGEVYGTVPDFLIGVGQIDSGRPANFQINVSPHGLAVVVVITYLDEVEESVVERWERGIADNWDGRFAATNQSISYPIHVQPLFVPAKSGLSAVGNMIEVGGSGRGASHRWPTEDHPTDPAATVENVAAHEFGHLLGNADEYGLSRENMVAATGQQPAQHHENTNGTFTNRDSIMGALDQPVEARHFQRIADWLNDTVPGSAEDPFRLTAL